MKLSWDETGTRLYQTGVSKVVLYLREQTEKYVSGVAWNGVTNITEEPNGGETNDIFADNSKVGENPGVETYTGTIEAFTYPDEFKECDGSPLYVRGVHVGQQHRKRFGLCYRTEQGNDVDDIDYGYKLHLIYNCRAQPSQIPYESINDTPNLIRLSWKFTTIPSKLDGFIPTSYVEIDSTTANSESLALLESVLYGSDISSPRLPTLEEIFYIMGDHDPSWISGNFVNLDMRYFPTDTRPITNDFIMTGFYPSLDERRF